MWQRPSELLGVTIGITIPGPGVPPPPKTAPTAFAAAVGGASEGDDTGAAAGPTAAQRSEWAELEREWVAQVDPGSHRTYYVNERLGETSWERPVFDPTVAVRQAERLGASTAAPILHACMCAYLVVCDAAKLVSAWLQKKLLMAARWVLQRRTRSSRRRRRRRRTLPSLWTVRWRSRCGAGPEARICE